MKKQLLVVLLALVLVFSMVSLIACVDPEEPATYTLTYAAGEGSGTAPAAEQYEAGAKVTLKAASTFTAPEGKEFDGWLIEGSKLAAGAEYTMPAKAVTATAQWKSTGSIQPSVTLSSISATYEGTIEVNGSIDAAKLTVTASYSDSTSKAVTTYQVGTIDTATAGDKQVTISYTEGGVTKECTVTITVAAPQPEAPAITAAANISIQHEGEDTTGWLVLESDGEGSFFVADKDDEQNILLDANITYTINSEGELKITSASAHGSESSPIVVPAIGSIVGHTVSITVKAAAGENVEYKFESEVYKLRIEYGFEIEDGVSVTENYIPAGQIADFTDIEREGYTIKSIKANGEVISMDDAKEIAMPASDVTIIYEWEEVEQPEAPAITDEVNAIILHESETASGAKIKGEMDLFDDGTGLINIENAASGFAIVEYAEITYSIDSEGVFKILTVNGANITVPATGSVIGNLVSITIENASASGSKVEYKFESEVYKLTINYGYEKYEGISSIEQYIPVGMTNDFTQEQREGHTLKAIKVNGEALPSINDAQNLAMPAMDVTISYEWEAIQAVSYTVTYKAGEGVGEDYEVTATSSSYKLLQKVAADEHFSREGWALIGWTVNGEEKAFGATITLTGDTVVIARYRQTFTVALAGLDVSGVVRGGSGDWNDLLNARYSEVSKFPLPAAQGGMWVVYYVERSGFTLVGWTSSVNGETYNPGEQVAITENTTFTAEWQQNAPVTDTSFDGKWVSEEGLVIESISLEIYELTIDGKNFTSEELNGELTINGSTATMTVGAIEYTLTVDEGVLTISAKRLSTTYTGEFTKFASTNKTLSDYEGYYIGEIEIDGDTYDLAWIEDGTLYLQEGNYSPISFELTEDRTGAKLVATFEETSGSGWMSSTTVVTVTFNSDSEFEVSYVLDGAFGSDDAEGTFTKTSLYTVTYALGDDYHGEEAAPEAVQVVGGRKTSAPTLAKVLGWKLLGWYAEGAEQAFDFNQPITANITLTAHWEQITQVTVTFAIQAGVSDVTAPAAQTIAFNTVATEPTESMAREGYRFDGWFNGNTLFDFETPVTEDITLTAKWSLIYTVTYVKPDGAEGEVPEVLTVGYGDTYTFIASPFTMQGYEFLGWIVGNSAAINKAGASREVYSNMTLTAVFGTMYANDEDNDEDYNIAVLHDNTCIYFEYRYTYQVNSNYSNIIDLYYQGEHNFSAYLTEDHTYIVCDEMAMMSFSGVAEDDSEVTLTFNGIGKAHIGEAEVDYTTITQRGYVVGITINDQDIYFDYDDNDNIIINAKITVNGADYIFGNPPEEWTITFELGEGEEGTAPEAITVWSNVGEVTLPSGEGITKEGYKFVGWKVKDGESDEHWTGTIEVSGSGTLVPAWEEDNGTPDTPSNKLSDFGGNTEAEAIEYGFDSADDATSTLVIGTMTNYKISLYWGKNGGVDCWVIKRYYKTSSGSLTTGTHALMIGSDKITSLDADNSGTYIIKVSGNDVSITFGKNSDNVKTVTITYDGSTVTWAQIGAGEEEETATLVPYNGYYYTNYPIKFSGYNYTMITIDGDSSVSFYEYDEEADEENYNDYAISSVEVVDGKVVATFEYGTITGNPDGTITVTVSATSATITCEKM